MMLSSIFFPVLLAVVLSIASSADAFWRMNCGIIQTGRVDPIISPNSVSAHVHKIAGGSNINIGTAFSDLSASSCTSCTIQADKSAYWTPQLYFARSNGTYTQVPNGGMTVYYLGRGEGTAKPFPAGFKMVSGNNSARSYDSTTLTVPGGRPLADRVSFACIDWNNPSAETPGMVKTNCPNGLRAQVHMQTCWNGADLYKSDQSHVSHLSTIDNGVCPPTHPVLLPHLFYEVLYDVNSVDQTGGGKFMFANGDTTGYAFHGDFMNGWNNAVLSDAITNCLFNNPSGTVSSCSSFASSNVDDSEQICPERAPIYPCEKVHGLIPKLPGCSSGTTQITCSSANQPACAAVANPAYLSASKGNAEFSLLGCYSEPSNQRALLDKMYTDTVNMTVNSCLAFCTGYKYAGVEWSQECYCGNTLSSGSNSDTQDHCLDVCTGNQYQTCGGGDYLNLYRSNSSSILRSSKCRRGFGGDA